MVYASHFSTQKTPQSQPIPGKTMVKNSAGGYAFQVNDWTRLDRFLILGAEGGTYYIGERKLTLENANAVMRCIAEDGLRVVNRVVEISQAGRAPKNDPAIFVLAMCASESCGANLETRRAAFKALPDVCRIFTHLTQFMTYTNGVLRGCGRGVRGAIEKWYDMPAQRLAYQMVKYRNRNGWTHSDALRISHARPLDAAHNALYGWVTGKEYAADLLPPLIGAYEQAQSATKASEIIPLIQDYGLTREMIPNTLLSEPSVWEALLEKMPMTAMVRNLGKMSAVGLLKPLSDASRTIVERLRDEDYLRKSRIHPLNVLVALRTYQQGHGMKGSLKWTADRATVDALDDAFYLSFGNVKPSGKRIMLALDVSGSMRKSISNMPISCREASTALSMVTARTEQEYVTVVFSATGKGIKSARSAVSYYDISPRQRLDDVVNRTRMLPFAGTDCALPMILATMDDLKVDAFYIYTDSETWAGKIHPVQALKEYRQKSGIAAKMVVVGMVSNGFSIADPDDSGMMDVVGFDTAVPQIMADFVK